MTKPLLKAFLLSSLLGLYSTPLWADEPVVWTNMVNTSASGSDLTKTSGAVSAWDAGAVSVQVIRDGYGYVEFTAANTTSYALLGLSNGDSNQDYADIDFAIIIRSDTTVGIYEAGTNRGNFGSYAAND